MKLIGKWLFRYIFLEKIGEYDEKFGEKLKKRMGSLYME